MGVNKLLRIGFNRLGYDYEYLKRVSTPLYGGTYLFKDEDKAVLALQKLKLSGDRVVIWPDFDVDGISAGCVLYAGLNLMGIRASIFAPGTRSGYGMHFSDADRLLNEFPDVKAVLTCDVGIAAWDVIGYLQANEVDVYVTDHHPETSRSTADAVVDPSRMDDGSPFKGVCGAFVAWHLVMLYAKLACTPEIQELVRKLVLFAGLGSVGDAMPVTHDTRYAIRDSLTEINALLEAETLADYFKADPDTLPDAYTAPFDNLKALHFHLLREGTVRHGDVDDEMYGFKYCPMLNSFKRLGGDMATLYKLLYRKYEWNSEERLLLCKFVSDQNVTRKEQSQALFKDMLETEQPYAPYIYVVDAFAGMLGPLASKMSERTGLPCLVLRPDGDGYKGSGRTPEWFPSRELFNSDGCTADGHDHAFGAYVPAESMQAMRDRMHDASKARPTDGQYGLDACVRVCVNGHAPEARYDLSVSRVDDHDVLMDYAMSISAYRPFGEGLEEPLFVLYFLKSDIRHTRAMGSDKSHLRLDLDHNVTVIWFSNAKFLDETEDDPDDTMYALLGRPGLDEFNGSVSLRFMASGRAM